MSYLVQFRNPVTNRLCKKLVENVPSAREALQQIDGEILDVARVPSDYVYAQAAANGLYAAWA